MDFIVVKDYVRIREKLRYQEFDYKTALIQDAGICHTSFHSGELLEFKYPNTYTDITSAF